MYIARGTRPELCRSVNCLASRVSSWDENCEQFLEHLLGYILHVRLEIRYKIQTRPFCKEEWEMIVHTDSNFLAPRSHSGCAVYYANKVDGTKYIVDWTSKRQTSTALSSCEAETIALVQAARTALNWVDFMNLVEGRIHEGDCEPVVPKLFCDNLATVLGAKRGYSKQLSYLSRTFGTSVGWIHNLIEKKMVTLSFISGVKKRSGCIDENRHRGEDR